MKKPVARFVRLYGSLIFFNLLVAAAIASGLVLHFAYRVADLALGLVLALIQGKGEITKGGYPGDECGEIVLVTLLPNLVLQYTAVRVALRSVAPHLCRNPSFVAYVWRQMFFYGLPLLLLVFLYDIGTSLFYGAGFWELAAVLAWGAYCYVASLLRGRSYLRSRATGILPLCANCGYWLEGLKGTVCPECGKRRDM